MGILLKLCSANLKQLKEYKKSLKCWKKDFNEIFKIEKEKTYKLEDFKKVLNQSSDFSTFITATDNDIFLNYTRKDPNSDYYLAVSDNLWTDVPITRIIQVLDSLCCNDSDKKEKFKDFLISYLELLKDCIISEILILSKPYYKKQLLFEKEDRVNDKYFYIIELLLEEDTYELDFCIFDNKPSKKGYSVKIEDVSLSMLTGLITSLKIKIMKKYPGGMK